MATPFNYKDAELPGLGTAWFNGVDADSQEGAIARTVLTKRGYLPKKDDKGKAVGIDHHAEGKALFKTMTETAAARAIAKPSTAATAQKHTAEEAALVTWLRTIYKDVKAAYDSNGSAALAGVQKLGPIIGESAIDKAAKKIIGVLSEAAAQAALKPFNIGSDDAKEGQALLEAWQKSLAGTGIARGSETTIIDAHIEAREAFRNWLAVWWAIAKNHLKKQPAVLEALGVNTKALKAKGKGGGKKAIKSEDGADENETQG